MSFRKRSSVVAHGLMVPAAEQNLAGVGSSWQAAAQASKGQRPQPGSSASNVAMIPVILNVLKLETLPHRVKALPPDANAKASSCVLYQLEEDVSFSCQRCRRQGIRSDSLAADPKIGTILCVSCYARIVRPRKFKPKRLVPFVSLLSWLNYSHPRPLTEVPEDLTKRSADAVAPSGRRVASLATSAQNVSAVPTTPMQFHSTEQEATEPGSTKTDLHPCERVWGACMHGNLCFFAQAPACVSIEYLMGIESRESGETRGLECVSVFGLPQSDDLCPIPVKSAEEFDREDSDIIKWVRRRQNSDNKAEWQLFNNGDIKEMLRKHTPVSVAEVVEVEDPEMDMDALREVLDGI